MGGRNATPNSQGCVRTFTKRQDVEATLLEPAGCRRGARHSLQWLLLLCAPFTFILVLEAGTVSSIGFLIASKCSV